MQMKSSILAASRKAYLEDFSLLLWRKLRRTAHLTLFRGKRISRGLDQSLIEDYLARHDVSKLHVGAGANLLRGWLNTDYYPGRSDTLHLDAVKRFPFENDTFDYVFSEHMIEHVDYHQGLSMLSECFRVLKPGGRIRISTPDFQFLIDLYTESHSPVQERFLDWMGGWMNERKAGSVPDANPIFVINNFVRDWGHQFIYDEAALRCSLEKVGFADITRHRIMESDEEALRNLENEKRCPDGILQLETMTLEATKRNR